MLAQLARRPRTQQTARWCVGFGSSLLYPRVCEQTQHVDLVVPGMGSHIHLGDIRMMMIRQSKISISLASSRCIYFMAEINPSILRKTDVTQVWETAKSRASESQNVLRLRRCGGTWVRFESAGCLSFSPLRIQPCLFYLWLISILRPSMQILLPCLICKFGKLAYLFIFAGKGFVRGTLWPFRSAGATRPQQQPRSQGVWQAVGFHSHTHRHTHGNV